jgi:N-acetyltransferase
MPSRFDPAPVTLAGSRVRLQPLTAGHTLTLLKAASDPEVFRWYATRMDTPEALQSWIESALAEQRRGLALPFVVIDRATGETVGSTRFGNVDRSNLRVEIGWTWIVGPWQRTGLNREAKLLMLTHAFEVWHVRRVEFKTHSENTKSRTALLRLGAVEEGTLRKHMVMPDGSVRDSVYFSILDNEWLTVKANLQASLSASRPLVLAR